MNAAGWHPDPGVPGRARYWDGAQWTEHVSALQSPPIPVGPVAPAAPLAPYSPAAPAEYGPYAPTTSAARPMVSPVTAPKNSTATTAMVLGIISLLINPFCILSILAIVYGFGGRKQVEQARAASSPPVGSGAATAGIVLGIIGSVGFVLLLVVNVSRL